MAAFSPPAEMLLRTQAWDQVIERALQGGAPPNSATAPAPAPAAVATSPPVSRSALSDALVQNGLAAVRTGSALSPSPPPSPARSSGGLSPEASGTPRSALTAALRQAGLAGATPLATG